MNALAQELRDVKPPVEYPSSLSLIIAIILTIIFIIAALFIIKKLTGKREAKPKAILPPWQRALKELDTLEGEGLLGKEYYDQYYSQLSDILRKYIEEQLSIRAPEMTTEEFLNALKTSADLTPEQKESLKDFLESCDMVKFAKYAPDPSEAKASYELAKKFIEETKPKQESV